MLGSGADGMDAIVLSAGGAGLWLVPAAGGAVTRYWLERTVWAWDFDPDSGDIANRRTLVQVAEGDGAPDGATVDAEGFIWLAHWNGWRVTRYDPMGRLDRVVRLPVQRPTCPAFGGADLDVLYVTSASINLSAEERTRQPWAGGLLALDPGVRGLAEQRFRG